MKRNRRNLQFVGNANYSPDSHTSAHILHIVHRELFDVLRLFTPHTSHTISAQYTIIASQQRVQGA